MLNSGQDNKEKLEENMQEIRQMVQEEDEDLGNPPEPEKPKDLDEIPAPEPEEPAQEPQETGSREENSGMPSTEQTGNEDEVDSLENQIKDKIDSIENRGMNRSQKDKEVGIEQEEVKDAEETIFLEVDRFEEIKQMIEEMHYLTSEMDDVMEHLQVGIEEDAETSQEGQEIIQEFQKRRDKIENNLENR
jgi:hypothetical protein